MNKENVSRRSFLGGMAAIALTGGLALTGCSPSSKNSEVSGTGSAGAGTNDVSFDEECDVLVIGGGGAGGAVAYAAAKEGASVIVLESQPNTQFTSTALCGGFISFVGTPEQAAAGIDDSYEVFLNDVKTHGGNGYISEDLIRAFCDNCVAYIDALDEIGVTWLNRDEPMQGKEQSVPRIVQVDPVDHQQKLTDAATVAGADYRYNTAGSDLVVDGSGKVVGALTSEGKAIKANKGVVVATGGFTRNDDMLRECMPGLDTTKVVALSSPGHTGEGHKMLGKLGVPIYGRTTINAMPGLHPEAKSISYELEAYSFGAVDVDKVGRRFCNESDYYSFDNTYGLIRSNSLAEDGYAVAYQILDQKAIDVARSSNVAYAGISDELIGLMEKADTLAELAERLGMPYLEKTVSDYNEGIASAGKDAQFGRENLSGEGSDEAFALEQAPFYAYPYNAWLPYNPTVGMPVNGECQALNEDGEVIDGVYLAGEIMSRSLFGDRYPDGVSTAQSGAIGLYLGKKLATA